MDAVVAEGSPARIAEYDSESGASEGAIFEGSVGTRSTLVPE